MLVVCEDYHSQGITILRRIEEQDDHQLHLPSGLLFEYVNYIQERMSSIMIHVPKATFDYN